MIEYPQTSENASGQIQPRKRIEINIEQVNTNVRNDKVFVFYLKIKFLQLYCKMFSSIS